jgi:hypothetical protein
LDGTKDGHTTTIGVKTPSYSDQNFRDYEEYQEWVGSRIMEVRKFNTEIVPQRA